MSVSPGREQPPYARIAAAIRARIVSGELPPGRRVPSTREITREWSVAMATASRALSELRQAGLVEAVRGVGTVVRGVPAPEPSHGGDDLPQGTSGPGERRGRSRPEAALTREAVVRAALDVVDAEGIDDFSMRRVAAERGVSTMALYRHVDDRTDLVSAMIEATYRDAQFPQLPDGDWRGALETAMRWEWRVLRRHPWVVQLAPATGPYVTPAVMAATEQMMNVITAEGRSPDAALEIVTALQAFTDGMAVQGLLVETEDRELDAAPGQWWLRRAPDLVRLGHRERFSTVFSVSGPPAIERIFTLGMEHLLDGLAPAITADRHAQGPEGSPVPQ